MLKFFRQIRYKLMSKGKTSRYLKYALGEILLVVIGILIALQINNWNESRKDSRREKAILSEIKNELDRNVKRLKACATYDSLSVRSFDTIISYLENKMPYTDAVGLHFANIIEWCAYDIVSTSYNSLKQTLGIDLISQANLRDQIVSLYEEDYPFGTNNINQDESDIHNILILPKFTRLFVVEYGKNEEDIQLAVPIEYKSLLNDNEFLTSLKLVRNKRNWSVEHDIETYYKTVNVIEEIAQFLND